MTGEILCTGHHQDDQAETLLLQLFRGSGVAGLSAMPKNKTIHGFSTISTPFDNLKKTNN